MKTRYENVKTQAIKRLNIIKGQVTALQRQIDEDNYCIDLLNQSLAIQNSLKSLDSLLFKRHLETHVVDQIKNSNSLAIDELHTLFKRINK